MTSISLAYSTDSQRWQAIEQRDPAADGIFYYAVRTTGVYCRPSCRSRRPKPENIEYFDDCQAAERNGFRACKRCRPADRACPPAPTAIVAACRLLERAEGPTSLAEIAEQVGLSPYHFHRLFRRIVGVTPKAYAAAQRIKRLQTSLQAARESASDRTTITQALQANGYASSSSCYRHVDEQLGMTPDAYRRAGLGHSVRYAVVPCALGWLAVAATDRGVCMIELGDAPNQLAAEVANRFQGAATLSDDACLRDFTQQVVSLIESPHRPVSLPLDIRGTAFQRQVWEALRAVPAGSTVSYSELAQQVGRPQAIRATASAVAANSLAIVIPCHRAIRSDGGLSGYRWGAHRKQQLLDRESLPPGS